MLWGVKSEVLDDWPVLGMMLWFSSLGWMSMWEALVVVRKVVLRVRKVFEEWWVLLEVFLFVIFLLLLSIFLFLFLAICCPKRSRRCDIVDLKGA